MRILGVISTPAIITESKADKKASQSKSKDEAHCTFVSFNIFPRFHNKLNKTNPCVYMYFVFTVQISTHVYTHHRNAVYTKYINACLILCCQICIEPRRNCYWIDIILIFVAFYRKKIWRKIIAGREIRTHDPWVCRPMRYHMRHGAH